MLATTPQAKESEEVIVGSVLVKPDLLLDLKLKPEYFGDEKLSIIFSTMLEMQKDDVAIDIVSVANYLKKKNVLDVIKRSYLAKLVNYYIGSPLHYHEKLVYNAYKARELLKVSMKIETGIKEEKDPDDILTQITKVADNWEIDGESGSIEDAVKLHDIQLQEMMEKKKRGLSITGLETGFKKLDTYTDGIKAGQLWAIGAPTNTGKSTFVLNIANHLITQGKKVDFYTLEMSKEEIITKLLSIRMEVDSLKINRVEVSYQEIRQARDKLAKLNLKIFEEKSTLDEIVLNIKKQALRDKPDLVIIDYAQNIHIPKANGVYDSMSLVATTLQRVARQTKIPIMFVSQMSNESIYSQERDELKGAGELKSAPNVVVVLRRNQDIDDYLQKQIEGEGGELKIKLAKNRGGLVTNYLVNFKGNIGKFTEIEESFQEEDINFDEVNS